MDTLYSDILLDLYRRPLNKKPLANFDVSEKVTNPLCGDEIELFIKFNKNDTVAGVGWMGNGCAVSQTAASLLTEEIKNKTKAELKKITPQTIAEPLGLTNLNPTRTRCLLLAFTALQKITTIEQ